MRGMNKTTYNSYDRHDNTSDMSNLTEIKLSQYSNVIDNLEIFPLISPCDIVTINKLSVIPKIIGQYEVNHTMTLPIKINNVCFKGLDIQYHLYHI